MTEYLENAVKCIDITISAAENRLKSDPENKTVINLLYDLKTTRMDILKSIADYKINC